MPYTRNPIEGINGMVSLISTLRYTPKILAPVYADVPRCLCGLTHVFQAIEKVPHVSL